jgi:hypothetical protein
MLAFLLGKFSTRTLWCVLLFLFVLCNKAKGTYYLYSCLHDVFLLGMWWVLPHVANEVSTTFSSMSLKHCCQISSSPAYYSGESDQLAVCSMGQVNTNFTSQHTPLNAPHVSGKGEMCKDDTEQAYMTSSLAILLNLNTSCFWISTLVITEKVIWPNPQPFTNRTNRKLLQAGEKERLWIQKALCHCIAR